MCGLMSLPRPRDVYTHSLSEEKASFENTVSALKAAHEAELQAAAEKLERSSSDGNRAKM